MSVTVMIVLNTAWNIVNFRAGLIRALVAHGHQVMAAAPPDSHAPRLAGLGCRFHPVPRDRHGIHPGKDLLLLIRYYRLFRATRPDVLLVYTVKPNIYASLAGHVLGIQVVNNIAGLGAVFMKDSWLTGVVRMLYRCALKNSRTVFFQNQDDMRLFLDGGLVQAEQAQRIPGSGIDLDRFPLAAYPEQADREFHFLLHGRLLRDKGVLEFVEAARLLKAKYTARYSLLGFVDDANPNSVSLAEIRRWEQERIITDAGTTDDVRPYIAEADCIVLPSYREGLPRSLLEAAALGRPLITTRTPGCQDVVEHEVNGFLCRPRSVESLMEQMERMLALPAAERREMGLRGREKVAREFAEELVIERYLRTITGLDQDSANKRIRSGRS